MNLLEVEALHVAYGGIRAIKGISFEVREGELVSLLGANGAGKTTTLKALTALHPKLSGSIRFQNYDTGGLGAWELAKRGLVMVPEGRGSFTRMTIVENLQMGAYLRNDKDVDIDIEKVFALFPRLKERRKQLAGTMSGGEQQMLAMGRALMARPRLLLLDEPSMGLSPIMVDTIFEVIRNIHQEGMTILLVEQNAARALQVADRAYVIESGEIIMQGEASMMLNDPRVRAAYLGE
jgi:branched-chain amino acid transport system ATP-binding protein